LFYGYLFVPAPDEGIEAFQGNLYASEPSDAGQAEAVMALPAAPELILFEGLNITDPMAMGTSYFLAEDDLLKLLFYLLFRWNLR